MKKCLMPLFVLFGFLCLAFSACAAETPAQAPEEENSAEWTVLFYLCGSDLESRYSYATGNLQEILSVDQLISVQADDPETEGGARKGKVNVVVETGGAAQWHAGDLGMDISEDSLQRWVCGTERVSEYSVVSRMELRESCPLSSMADPDTLADFIRWGVENYPAKNTPWSCGTTAEAH